MKSHAQAVATLRGAPRQTRKARARRKDGVGSQPRYVSQAIDDRGVTIAVRIESEANERGNWRAGWRRSKQQRDELRNLLPLTAGKPTLPCVVLLTRIAPRPIKDEHDNLPRAFKACVDEVAAWLGVDDSDPRVVWRYAQERGAARTYGVRVQWSDWSGKP
jgi:hypothetical protein